MNQDNSFTILHTYDQDGLQLLPELETKDLPNDMWGMGLMSLLIDFEDMFTQDMCSHFVRFAYVLFCGILNIWIQRFIPNWLVVKDDPLISAWAVSKYSPLQANYELYDLAETATTSTTKKADFEGEKTTTPKTTTTIAPLQALERVQIHHPVPGPYSEGHMVQHGGWWFPCGFIGWILALFLFLWIAQMARQITIAFEFFTHVFYMPKVHAEYNSLSTFPGPSQCNHIIRRNKKSEVYAVTSCTRFFSVFSLNWQDCVPLVHWLARRPCSCGLHHRSRLALHLLVALVCQHHSPSNAAGDVVTVCSE